MGCSGSSSLEVSSPSPTGVVASQCAAVVAAAPTKVAGLSRRHLSPARRYAAAWGQSPVVLTCGGPAPAALRPTSQCFVVNGVGWLATQHGTEVDPTQNLTGELDFTTIGRSAYVAVRVPGNVQPAADALVDLAATVKSHTTEVQPCR